MMFNIPRILGFLTFWMMVNYCSLSVGEMINPNDLNHFSGAKDRSCGSYEGERTAQYILSAFKEMGLSQVGVHLFDLPVAQCDQVFLEVGGVRFELYCFAPNLVYIPQAPAGSLEGPVVDLKDGSWEDLNDKDIKGSIVLSSLSSSDFWMTGMLLGAKALIYMGDKDDTAPMYKTQITRTPVKFPRYWLPPEEVGRLRMVLAGGIKQGRIVSAGRYQRAVLKNIYGLLPGSDPRLRNELVVIEAGYDASNVILGKAPGMDEASSIMALLDIARTMAKNPPKRSVLFLATAGRGHAFAGVRSFSWALNVPEKYREKERKEVEKAYKTVKKRLQILSNLDLNSNIKGEDEALVWPAFATRVKDIIDDLSYAAFINKLSISSRGRLTDSDAKWGEARKVSEGATRDLLILRSLVNKESFKKFSEDEKKAGELIIKELRKELKKSKEELELRSTIVESSQTLIRSLEKYQLIMSISLYFSSSSPFIDLKYSGTLYPLKEDYTKLNQAGNFPDVSRRIVKSLIERKGAINPFSDGMQEVEGGFNPKMEDYPLPSDPISVSGLPGVTITCAGGEPLLWGTPLDTSDRWDVLNFIVIKDALKDYLYELLNSEHLKTFSKNKVSGLAQLEGKSVFVRQGELFPDRAAGGTIINAIQGDSLFTAISYGDGYFSIPGLANKKVSFQKVILEPYGIDIHSGDIKWAGDKRGMEKDAYRVKVSGKKVFTTLIMFRANQTDVIGVFKPQRLSYLTKVNVIDASTETNPAKYWYSRMDGRDTMVLSIFTEPFRRFKLVLADSLITRDVLFLNAKGTRFSSKEEGIGFAAGSGPLTTLDSVEDMKLLLGDRLRHFKDHGIVDQFLDSFYLKGLESFNDIYEALHTFHYDKFWHSLLSAWAFFSSGYNGIDKTQRDVLSGVMFFIALVIPFAYCLERFVFCFDSLYSQIAGFVSLVVVTVLLISYLHPAFKLTYSPFMVIVAFFIVGLSGVVIWIVYNRFEQEIASLRQGLSFVGGSSRVSSGHLKFTQALGIGLYIGVSNLHRRPLRTFLTCLTISILTFTIMSFTSVKTFGRTTVARIGDTGSYEGLLIHHPFWFNMTDLALRTIESVFRDSGRQVEVLPRGWVEFKRGQLRWEFKNALQRFQQGPGGFEGIVGLSSKGPQSLKTIIKEGRWLRTDSLSEEIIISSSMADKLTNRKWGDGAVGQGIRLKGRDFVVVGVFDEGKLARWKDLNDKTILPFYMEKYSETAVREAEVEALESGVEILPGMGTFVSPDPGKVAIVSYGTCKALGGVLKAVQVVKQSDESKQDLIPDEKSLQKLVEKISFLESYSVFAGGKEGSWFVGTVSALRYEGLTDLAVPVMIVVLVCFNTLLSHVQERKREIAVYTGLGLAPNHVGLLFTMEAMSLAALSSIFGYLGAQFVAKYLKNLPLFSDLSVNYSSLSGIASIVVIFGVVFVASLYPSRLATRLAMPDVEKTWKVPTPEKGVLLVELPFLFKEVEEESIVRYVGAFIEAGKDTSSGEGFITDDFNFARAASGEIIERGKDGATLLLQCSLIQATVWLAPFDFGIKQRVHIYCCPAGVEGLEGGYVQIHVRIVYLSGELDLWHKANKGFIRQLRKHILKWHSLLPSDRHNYQVGDGNG